MPLTGVKVIEAFKHIPSQVFRVPDDGPLSKGLESAGYGNIWELATLSDAAIESLTFD